MTMTIVTATSTAHAPSSPATATMPMVATSPSMSLSNRSTSTATLLPMITTSTILTLSNKSTATLPSGGRVFQIGVDEFDQSIILGVLVAITTVGIICNSLMLNVLASDQRLHRAPFYFLTCVSVMDLAKSVFCLPFVIEVVFNDFEWLYSHDLCLIVAFGNSFFTSATGIGLLALVIDRYLAITAARFYAKCSYGTVCVVVIAVGWGVSFCLAFPPMFKKQAYRFIPGEMQCTFYHMPYRENDTLGYTIAFVCVLVLTLFLYCRMFLFMRSHRRMAPLYHHPARSSDWTFFGPGANGQALINLLNGFTTGAPNPYAANAQQVRQNVGRLANLFVLKNEHIARLFFVITLSFVLLWILYLFQLFSKVFNDSIYISPRILILSVILTYSHVAVTPTIALVFGSPLRISLFNRAQRCLHGNADDNGVGPSDVEYQEPGVRCIELTV